MYVVVRCRATSEVWSLLNIAWQTEVSDYEVHDRLLFLFTNNSLSKCMRLAIGVRASWSPRNKRLHDGIIQDAKMVVLRFINSCMWLGKEIK